jgi:two-component system alkaline phosphatase synthesis response regulator PhoP
MTKRILLCDDEIAIIRATEYKLMRAGYEVECTSDGQLGWEAILRNKPDLLITDCQMPRLNGLALIQRVRETPETRDLKILMLTGKGFELSEQEMADKCHVLGIICKPFSPRELLARVDRVLAAETAGVAAG